MNGIVVVAALFAAAGSLHAAFNVRGLRVPAPDRPRELVTVLIPARNEATRIAPCVASVLASRGVDLEVLVLDDESTDATAEVVLEAARGDPRLRVLTGVSPPPGWLGKPAACARVAEQARGTVLVFVDADVVLAPDGLAGAVTLLRRDGLDLLSPYPRQLADGFGPRLVQPLLQWSWLTFVPLRAAERVRRPSLAIANGQLLVCDAAAYHRVGGHAAVRGKVLEDVELARAFVRSGAKVALADGTALASCRMYDDWGQVRDGYAKSLWAAFGSPAGAVMVITFLTWLYVAPPAAAVVGLVRRRPLTVLAGAAGYGAGVAGRLVTARRTGGRTGDAFAHPLSVLALAALTWRSLRGAAHGSLRWRGREVRHG